MPVNPSVYAANAPLTATAMNQDLYTFTPGNNHTPNGILFHSNPPLVMSNMRTAVTGGQPSSAAGTYNLMSLTGFWRAAIDTSCLFGTGGDLMGPGAAGHFLPTVKASAGAAGSVGGNYLAWCVSAFGATTNNGGSGAALFYGGVFNVAGGQQQSSTTRDNAGYALDIVNVTTGSGSTIGPGGWCADASLGSFAYKVAPADHMGDTCHFGTLWSGPLTNLGVTVPSSLPVPTTGYGPASVITSAGMNGNNLAAPLAFLNNPPQLRAAAALTTPLTSGVVTALVINSVTLDNWAGFNTGTGQYTVPVSGVYLVHVSLTGPAPTSGNMQAGVVINGTLNLWGPAYQNAGNGNTRPQMVRLLDLNAGDTVAAIVQTSANQSLGSAQPCRLVMRWMAALAGSNGSVTWTPPQTNYRWQAGTPGSQLPALFQSHLANDLSFLLQRPYLLAYQSTQQTGLAQNTFQIVTMNTLGGRVHASAGDNYGGWTSGAANQYAAKVPGWYLCIASYIQALPSATPAHCLAAVGYFQSGGANQGSAAQQWGQHVRTTTTGLLPGAEEIGLFYLRAGDFVQPQYQQQDGGATFSTGTGAGLESSFGCVWVSE